MTLPKQCSSCGGGCGSSPCQYGDKDVTNEPVSGKKILENYRCQPVEMEDFVTLEAMIDKEIAQLTADRDTLLEALKYTTVEMERAGVHHSIVRQYKELFDKMEGK